MAAKKTDKPLAESEEDIVIDITADTEGKVLGTIEDAMADILSAADVDAVYDAPVEHGDTIIISAAEVMSGGGFGLGYGNVDGEKDELPNVGGGGGGGGYAMARPVAVIIATPDGVRVEPVLDITKIALAALTAAGMMFTTWLRMRRSR